MSERSPAPPVEYYMGNNNFDLLMWGSAHIIDAERDQQPDNTFSRYRVEWEDDLGRHCELTSRTVADQTKIHDPLAEYGHALYYFRRRDFRDNNEFVYVMRSDTKKIAQRDISMEMIPKSQRIPTSTLMKSILESYAAYPFDEILRSTPDTYDETSDKSEEEIFNEIVYYFEKEEWQQKFVRKLGREFMNFLGYGK